MTNPIEFGIQVARQAGTLLQERFNLFGTDAAVKDDRTVVTQADLDSERLIAEAIRRNFPQDGIISEEVSTVSPTKSGAFWIVDPLDGTTNYSLGLPFWGVSIARTNRGLPELGVIYFPIIDELYSAMGGQGAYLNDKPIHARPLNKNQPAAFFACCSRAHRRYQIDVRFKSRILGSAAYNLCAVARGAAVAGFEAAPKIWDLAAGWLLIQEAGGSIEPLNGLPPFPLQEATDFHNVVYPTITAATPELVEKIRSQIHLR
jgi:myo-inositol-1(or 4)-monophosphatase